MYGYIYLIINNLDGKTYIGKRHSDKFDDNYMGSGKYLKRAQKKYGIENFEKFFIQWTNSEEDACEKEKFWIKEYRKRGKAEYNIANGGQGGFTGVLPHIKGFHWYTNGIQNIQRKECPEGFWKGRTFSQELKNKYSENMKKVVKEREPWNKGKKCVQTAWNKGKKGYHIKNPPEHTSLKGRHWKLIDGKHIYF